MQRIITLLYMVCFLQNICAQPPAQSAQPKQQSKQPKKNSKPPIDINGDDSTPPSGCFSCCFGCGVRFFVCWYAYQEFRDKRSGGYGTFK